MKLESLKSEKFKGNALKREQMFTLNGGGTVTPGGNRTEGGYNYDYGYDSNRGDGVTTYHDRSNLKKVISIG
jgi:hypothetical protein